MADTNMNTNTMAETLLEALKNLVETSAIDEDSDVPENIFEKNKDIEEGSDVDIIVVNGNFTLSSMMEDFESMGTKMLFLLRSVLLKLLKENPG
jgi:hypothetical protein